MAATANRNIAMHTQAIDAFALRFDKGPAAELAYAKAATAEPAMIRKSLRPSSYGEMTTLPRKTLLKKLAENGVSAKHTTRLASVSATSRPDQSGERWRGGEARRRHLQDQDEEKVRHLPVETEQDKESAEQSRGHQHDPGGRRRDQRRLCEKAPQFVRDQRAEMRGSASRPRLRRARAAPARQGPARRGPRISKPPQPGCPCGQPMRAGPLAPKPFHLGKLRPPGWAGRP